MGRLLASLTARLWLFLLPDLSNLEGSVCALRLRSSRLESDGRGDNLGKSDLSSRITDALSILTLHLLFPVLSVTRRKEEY